MGTRCRETLHLRAGISQRLAGRARPLVALEPADRRGGAQSHAREPWSAMSDELRAIDVMEKQE